MNIGDILGLCPKCGRPMMKNGRGGTYCSLCAVDNALDKFKKEAGNEHNRKSQDAFQTEKDF